MFSDRECLILACCKIKYVKSLLNNTKIHMGNSLSC